MKRKHKRLWAVLLLLSCMGAGVALILSNLEENLVFFFTPKEITAEIRASQRLIRVGGLVKTGSVIQSDNGTITFRITDHTAEQTVHYAGLVPSLFREGQGVVAEGVFHTDGSLNAQTILAKHDENYMPPQVKDALKESGEWRGEAVLPKGLAPTPPAP